ncbi:MAG TPA: hypothetical protein LFW21_05475 [Rickettsia endosymbiont of Pyrocoelia pectoralis]|nr:hypothetical protein [Rickettsia endosymbiont of Pyrocoelia pectoralis]
MPKLENYCYDLLENVLNTTLDQNKVAKAYLLQKDYDNALNEIKDMQEKLEELMQIFSLLAVLKKHFSEENKMYK